MMFRVLIIVCAIITMFSSSSCAHPAKVPEKVKEARQSFSFIKITSIAKPKKCTYEQKIMGQHETKECDIEDLKPLTLRSFGSGIVVKHVIDTTYVMTAAHVCWSPKNDTKTIGHKTVTVEIKSRVQVTDGHGAHYQSEIYALDTKNDICILRAHGTFGKPIPVAEHAAVHPERVYTYGAPLAIHHPGVILMYSGFTAGTLTQDDREINFYTLVARPGSSGSSVLNKKGEIIGIIHTAITNIQDVAIGSDLKSIQTIVNSIPEVSYERID